MRTLTRPMFNMGGPIKQGIMHGIREPKKHGGKMLLVGQHPKEFQDKSGREKHLAPVVVGGLAAASRFLPAAWRGFKAARYWKPGTLGKWGRLKSLMAPTKGIGAPMAPSGAGAGFRVGSLAKQNPAMALTALTLPNVAGTGIYQHGPGAAKGAWGLTKRYADAVIPGDQSRWWKDPEPPKGVPLNPNLQMNIQKKKKTGEGTGTGTGSDGEFAKAQREQRLQKYLDMMGYDRSKKTAIADALIDASKIVSDRGTLDRKNITAELINPIIQATSKRLDKPDQIREAVGLMAAKAEIEKDLKQEENVLAKTLTQRRIDKLDQELGSGFEDDLRALVASRKEKVGKKQLERFARLTADKYGDTFTVVEDASVIADKPGVYMLEDKIFRVDENGVSKQIV